ncbi:MAG: hypothetical protein ACRD20_12065 [Terriglobales bacterium]
MNSRRSAPRQMLRKLSMTPSGESVGLLAGVKDPKGCWVPEDQLQWAENLAQAAGLNYITDSYIGEAARDILASRRPARS